MKYSGRRKGNVIRVAGDVAWVTVGPGIETCVDVADLDTVRAHTWWSSSGRYVLTHVRQLDGTYKRVGMQRVLLGIVESNLHSDHINGDRLDNRRSNLRACSQAQNNANRKKFKNATSQFIGVMKRGDRWVAHIQRDGRRVHLGEFDSEEHAARERDAAAQLLHGPFARLNFPKEG